MEESAKREIVTLFDEDNEPAGFQVILTLLLDNHEYLLVQELENPHADALILKRDGDTLAGIQEHEEYVIVKELFLEKFNELDTEDEIPL